MNGLNSLLKALLISRSWLSKECSYYNESKKYTKFKFEGHGQECLRITVPSKGNHRCLDYDLDRCFMSLLWVADIGIIPMTAGRQQTVPYLQTNVSADH